MAEELEGKIALVTGAAHRIGSEIVHTLARRGVHIVIHYNRSSAEAEKLRAEIVERGVKGWLVKADFEKPAEYETLIASACETAGSLDILINNASIFLPDNFKDMNFEGLVRHMQVNAWVPFVFCRQFADKVSYGQVVNILDTRINRFDWTHITYNLSKRILTVLTEMAALEFSPRIRVNGVSPGLILPPAGKDRSYLEKQAESVPLKRHGGPVDVAEAVVFLLTNDYLTGQVINVDGGMSIMEAKRWTES